MQSPAFILGPTPVPVTRLRSLHPYPGLSHPSQATMAPNCSGCCVYIPGQCVIHTAARGRYKIRSCCSHPPQGAYTNTHIPGSMCMAGPTSLTALGPLASLSRNVPQSLCTCLEGLLPVSFQLAPYPRRGFPALTMPRRGLARSQ